MTELFLELATEELPARFIGPALEGFAQGLVKLLAGIEHGAVRTFGTPRRLAVAVADVAPARPLIERLVTGPPAAQAWGPNGPGPAALAFAKGKGVDPAKLELVDGPKGKVVAARRLEGGERLVDVLAAGLDGVVAGIPFKKSMRWGAGTARFGRPLHHVTCVYGGELVEATVMGLFTQATSRGHWLLAPEPFGVTTASAWLATLRSRWVLADPAERRQTIAAQLAQVAAGEGLHCPDDDALLDEVTNLVEWPTVLVGHFPENLLELPARLLVESMKVNQRYFPLFTPDGRLSSRFLVVTNNPQGDPALITAGNARVLVARFLDARFFHAEDRRKSLVEHGARLEGMTWIRGLGTMAWRQAQVAAAARRIGPLVGARAEEIDSVADVLRADLCTLMVNEFPELQGHVGRLLAEGEGRAGALAIEESWLPRGAGDALPTTPEGLAFALADRAVLLGLAFADEALGLVPRGNADPQGIRRAAGAVASLLQIAPPTSLPALFEAAGFRLDGQADSAALRSFEAGPLLEFVQARFRAQMVAEGHTPDVVDAVLAAGGGELRRMAERMRAISRLMREGRFEPVRTTFRRVAGLARDHASPAWDSARFESPAEHALAAALSTHLRTDATDLLAGIVAIRPAVDAFFDAVLVMADDPGLRANRLGLLRCILDQVSRYADFSRLSADAAG